MRLRFFQLLILAGFPACKHAVQFPVKNPPQITVQAPAVNQHFVRGDTIRITGSVTCPVALTEVAVHMTDIPSNNEFFHNHFGPGNALSYNFYSVYPVTDTRTTTFKVQVEAVNANGDDATKEVVVTIN